MFENNRDISRIISYLRITDLSFRKMCSDGVMDLGLGCDWVLLSSWYFIIWVRIISDKASFDIFSLEKSK